jgi:hypothetical protein
MKKSMKVSPHRIIACIALLLCIASSRLVAQQRSYIIPDVCAPGMGTYIEIIGENTKFGQFGKDSIYANNPGDSVRVVLDDLDDSTKVIIGPVTVAWGGRMVSTHIFVLPSVQPNSSYWRDLDKAFRIPIRVVVQGQTTPNEQDTIYLVRPFAKIEDFSIQTSKPDSIVIGATGSGAERRSLRSRRGAIIAESVTLQAGKKYTVANDDTDSLTIGNQGFLPFVLLVRGAFEGNGATIDVSAIGRNGGVGGGGGGGYVCDRSVLGGGGGNRLLQIGGTGFTGGASGGVNNSALGQEPTWYDGGIGSGQSFATPERVNIRTDGGFSLNGVPGGLSASNLSFQPESTGGGTGHPFGLSGRGWLGGDDMPPPTAGGGNGQQQLTTGDGGGFGRGGLSPAKGSGIGGGGEHGNIAVVPIAGGSGGAGGNPQSFLGQCGGSGGGGGGAIRIAGISVRRVNLVAQGAAGSAGNQTRTNGGAGSGGHIAVLSKLSVSGINADVRSGEDENSGAGRMRFDTPDRIEGVKPLPRGIDYRFYAGITLDSTSQVRSPYTKPILINGFLGTSDTTRFYFRTTTGTWQQSFAIPDPTKQVQGFNNPVLFNRIIAPVRSQPRVEQDSLLFVVAGARFFDADRNQDTPPFIINPQWVFSQAAANILRVVPLPLVSVNTNNASFPQITRCENEEKSTTITITVRNTRGGLLTVNDIRFAGVYAPFFSVDPISSTNFTVRQNNSVRVTVRFSATRALRSDITGFQGRMQIFHNDTLPDIGGAVRQNPITIDLNATVQTIRYDIRPSRDLGAITEITGGVVDFGRVAVGGTEQVRIFMNNLNSATNRTPMRFEIRAATQPITATPFSFEERSTVSALGTTVIDVTFSPTMIGAATTQTLLVRTTNQSGNCPFDSTYRIVLRGTGIQPQLDTTRTTRSIDFGAFSVCAPATTTSSIIVNLANSGNDTLVVRSIRMSSTTTTATSRFSPSPSTLVLPAGQTGSFTLNYASIPTTFATTIVRDTVLLETNDARFGANTPFRIPVMLTLRSVNASVRLIPPDSTLAFGGVRIFGAQRTVFLANNGNVPVTVQLSMLRQPYRIVAPAQTRFTLQPNETQAITIEMKPTDAQQPGVTVQDTLRFITTPTEGQCALSLSPLVITGVPQGPASMLATLWLDTLNSVDMRRDTTIRLWGRVQNAIPNRTDNLRAGFLIRRGMFFPKTITSSFGTVSIESSQPRGADRAVVVNVANVALSETPTVIAVIAGTPILTDTMRAALVWLPDETRWARRDTIYFTDSLANGFMATFVPILSTPAQPRLTSGPVVGQMPRRVVIAGVQPNPVREGELTLTLNLREEGEYVVQVVNMLGERVVTRSWKHEATLSAKKDPNAASELVRLTLDVRGAASGAYIVRLLQPSGAVETFLVGIER